MTITKSFTKTDQLDAEGKKVDNIFTIKQVETLEFEKTKTLSGTEVAEKIDYLEDEKVILEHRVVDITEEINFYKSLK